MVPSPIPSSTPTPTPTPTVTPTPTANATTDRHEVGLARTVDIAAGGAEPDDVIKCAAVLDHPEGVGPRGRTADHR